MDTSRLLNRPFIHYMKAHPRSFTLGVGALLCTNVLDILTPLTIKMGIDAISSKDQSALSWAIMAYLGVMIGVTTFRYFWRIYFGRFHHRVAEDLRNRIFGKLTVLGPNFYQTHPVGQLMSLMTNDVNSFRMAIGPGVLILLDAVTLVLMIVPVMISLSWDWTWKTLILLPLIPFLIRKIESLIRERYRVQQDRLSEVSGYAQEIVSGIRVIKGFAQEENQRQRFNSFSKDYELACNRVAKVDSAFHPVMESGVALGSVILLWFCTPEVMQGAVTLGTFVAFHEYIKRMIWPMSAIGMGVSMLEQGRASFDRIREILQTDTDIPDHGDQEIENFEHLEIRGLSYRYTGAPTDALKDVSLRIHAGETIGIVGPVGAGKSTLLHILSRLLPVEPGRVLINGKSLEMVQRRSLNRLISYVTQDAFLFSETIGDNVALGLNKHPGLELITDSVSRVNLDHEIRSLPEGYETYLGERGVNLSGGQKQRLTIARALIRRSPLVLLDDSLSAVDGKTEKSIIQTLKQARSENPSQTVLVVSHRLATLMHADRIVVLNKGRVEAIGTHNELIEMSETYRHLHELQNEAPSDLLNEFRELSAGEH